MATGIPTIYKGVRFRSRLEAKWACFFDMIKLEWQYEPFDLPGWIPDFSITGQCFSGTLVEVKPNFDNIKEVKTKVLKSILSAPDCHERNVLILGNGPVIYDGNWPIFGHFASNGGDVCLCEWKAIGKWKEGEKGGKVKHVPLPIEESWFEWCDINLRVMSDNYTSLRRLPSSSRHHHRKSTSPSGRRIHKSIRASVYPGKWI